MILAQDSREVRLEVVASGLSRTGQGVWRRGLNAGVARGRIAAMTPHLTAALNHLDAATRDLRAAVDAVPVPQRGQKPAPTRWSVDEVIEHVAKVEQSFVGAVLSNLEAARATGLGPEIADPPMLPDQTRTRLIDRTNPRQAPEQALPTGTVDAMAAIQTIDATHARLKEALASCDGLALSTVTHEHRFFGTLNVYQWVELLAGHEGRHAAQVREISTQVAGI